MVLHRPVELAAFIRHKVRFGTKLCTQKLAEALHAEAVGSTLSFGRAVEMEIPTDNFSHLYLATRKASWMDTERGGIL
jgi:hypothetical protein